MLKNDGKALRLKLKNKYSKTSQPFSEYIFALSNKYKVIDIWKSVSKTTYKSVKKGYNFWKKNIEDNK